MMRPKALDLFCCAGGASMGLYQAGFDVVGVDIAKQPRYPFPFIRADVLNLDFESFDFIWASPPCQGYSVMRHAPGTVGAPLLIDQIRDRMPADRLWCIENVEAAAWALRDPILLCGSMFNLGAQGCQTQRHRPVIGVYGGHSRRRAASAGGRGTKDEWVGGHRTAASEALAINWMSLAEMSEAIPPAYARYIGKAAACALR
jgi:DNA (cytosine-5)-methyltransferase 1